MLTILCRTVIVYVLLMIVMRMMGKRQIGELEVSDLVTTLLISEIASLPITERQIPLSHAIIPIIVLLFFEVLTSYLTVVFPGAKLLLTARPSTLIQKGKICDKAMRESRISTDELLCELRQNGYADINEVYYAILEKSGKMTFVPRAQDRPLTCKDMKLKPRESGIFHIIIDKGSINKHGLSQAGLDKKALDSILLRRSVELRDVYLFMINDMGDERIILRSEVQ